MLVVLKVLRVPRVPVLEVLTVLMVLMVLPCSTALAQQPFQVPLPAAPYVGRTITAVSISVEGRPATETALADALQTKVGAPLSMQDVRETITHFYSLGRFADHTQHILVCSNAPLASSQDERSARTLSTTSRLENGLVT